MADSDKDVLITPNTSVATTHPEIKFVGKDNSPVYAKILDDNSVSFEGTEGQILTINPILSTGDIFSVNDISGIQSIAVNADGTITLNPTNSKKIIVTGGISTPAATSGGFEHIEFTANNNLYGTNRTASFYFRAPNSNSQPHMLVYESERAAIATADSQSTASPKIWLLHDYYQPIIDQTTTNSIAAEDFGLANASSMVSSAGTATNDPVILTLIDSGDTNSGNAIMAVGTGTSGGGALNQISDGQLYFKIDDSGDSIFYKNVGIGVTNPNEKLEVAGSILIDYALAHRGDSNNQIVFTTDTQTFKTDATDRMTITSAGNVGIGTESPGSLLHLSSSPAAGSVPVEMLRLENIEPDEPNDMVAGQGPAMTFYVPEGNQSTQLAGQIAVVREDATDANAAAAMSFWTAADDASPTEKMRITSAGDVGIGNAATGGYKLDVQSGTADSVARFKSSDNIGRIVIQDVDTSTYVISQDSYMSLGGTSSLNAANLNIHKTTGLVGIGTTSPSEALHIRSSSDHPLVLENDQNAAYVGIQFSDHAGDNYTQKGEFRFNHANSLSEGSGASFTFTTTESDLSIIGGKFISAVGSASEPGFGFSGDVDNGMFHPATNQIAFTTAGAEAVRVDVSGNVGIGTTAPSQPLHIAQSGTAQSTPLIIDNGVDTDGGKSVGMDFRVRYASSNIASSYIGFDYYGSKLTSNSHGMIYRSGRAGFAHHHFVADDNTRQMMIADDGDVGIGSSFTHAAQPAAKLDVDGTVNATNLTIGGAQGSDGQVLTSTGSGVGWEAASGGGVSLSGSTNNTIATVTGANALIGETNLKFDGDDLTIVGGTSETNIINFNDGANVGWIRYNHSTDDLEIGADDIIHFYSKFQDGTSTNIVSIGDAVGTGIKIKSGYGDVALPLVLQNAADDRNSRIYNTEGAGDSELAFWVGDGAAPTEKMVLDKSGNLGLWTNGAAQTISFASGQGLVVAHATQANVQVFDTTSSSNKTDFAQSGSDTYFINRSSTGSMRFRSGNSGSDNLELHKDGALWGARPRIFSTTNTNVTAQDIDESYANRVSIKWAAASGDVSDTTYFTHDSANPNEHKIQVMKAGWYHVNWSVMWDNDQTNRVTVEGVWNSGSQGTTEQAWTKDTRYSRGTSWGNQQNCGGSFWIQLSADDYMVLQMYYTDHDSDSTVNTVPGEGFVQITGWPDA